MILVSFIIWLSPRAGKMTQVARCDWLPERARWSHLARSGLPGVSRMKNFPATHIILLTKFVRRDIGLVLFCEFMDLDFVSVYKQAKKKELGQYPAILTEQTWSTTHMYIKKTRCWTTSTQSSLLQELVPSLLTKIPFDHMSLEDRQSFSANLMWASTTQK